MHTHKNHALHTPSIKKNHTRIIHTYIPRITHLIYAYTITTLYTPNICIHIRTTLEKLNKVIPKIHQDTTSTTEENLRG